MIEMLEARARLARIQVTMEKWICAALIGVVATTVAVQWLP